MGVRDGQLQPFFPWAWTRIGPSLIWHALAPDAYPPPGHWNTSNYQTGPHHLNPIPGMGSQGHTHYKPLALGNGCSCIVHR